MSQWYISVNGQQIGPISEEDAVTRAKNNPGGHAWKEGFGEWKPINQIPELYAGGPVPGPPPRGGSISHEIDWKTFGEEMQSFGSAMTMGCTLPLVAVAAAILLLACC